MKKEWKRKADVDERGKETEERTAQEESRRIKIVKIKGRKNSRRGGQMKKKEERGNREKEEQIRSTDADEGRVRLQRRINGRVGATTGRINSQPKRSKHRGKNDPAEEEWIMLREKHLGVDELPQQWKR